MTVLSLLELAEYLRNVSEACKVNGVSRQHFYDIKKAYEENGLEGLREKSRRRPYMKNRVAPEIEEAMVRMAYENPAYGQARAANELKKQGTLISSGGIRSIWLRHGLETFKKRLVCLEEKAAREGLIYTEAQIVALESAKRERESSPDEIEMNWSSKNGHSVKLHLPMQSSFQSHSVVCILNTNEDVGCYKTFQCT